MSGSSSTSDSDVSDGGKVSEGLRAALALWRPQFTSTGSVCTIGSMVKTLFATHSHSFQILDLFEPNIEKTIGIRNQIYTALRHNRRDAFFTMEFLD